MRPLIGLLAFGTLAALFLLPERSYGALPPSYGGRIVLPSLGTPRDPRSDLPENALEQSLASLVHDTLYVVDSAGRARPHLAAGMPEYLDGRVRIRLRRGARTQAGEELVAHDIYRVLRTVTYDAHPFLAGFTQDNGRVQARELDRYTIEIDLDRRFDVAQRLAALPLAIRIGAGTARGRGRGTGPFVSRPRDGSLELIQFRGAPRGAPRLTSLSIVDTASRQEEVRAFELGEHHVSFHGASLYRQNTRARSLRLPGGAVTLIGSSPRGVDSLRSIDGLLDRRRLARVGLAPSAELRPGHRPQGGARGTIPNPLRIQVDEHDILQVELLRAIRAQLDARRVTVDQVARGESADLRIARVVSPLLDDDAAWIASASLQARNRELAESAMVPGIADAELQRISQSLPMIVLGRAQIEMHYRRSIRGLRVDAMGRLRFDRAHFARGDQAAEDES